MKWRLMCDFKPLGQGGEIKAEASKLISTQPQPSLYKPRWPSQGRGGVGVRDYSGRPRR